jgi:hypothetical protein
MKKTINIAVTVLLALAGLSLSAQGGTPPPPPAVSGTIDGGAVVLLIVIAVYGYIKLKQKKQEAA